MKTPDQIKKGLECCSVESGCMVCPYLDHSDNNCIERMCTDALERIKLLEAIVEEEEQIILNQGAELDVIRDAPTIEAVPVVRCRECAYRFSAYCPMRHEEYSYTEDDGVDYHTVDYTTDDGFCHEGERLSEASE